MRVRGSNWLMSWTVLVLLLPWGATALAEDEKEFGWSDTADFSMVATSGNSESFTLGAKNLLTRTWEKAKLELTVGLIRAETNDIDRFAVQGAGGGAKVIEEDNKDTDPERYFFNGRYSRLISEKFFWYTGLDWERNRPSAVESRIIASGGVGNLWYDTDKIKFRTDYGLSYTDEEDTNGASTSFAGLRLGWNYQHKLNDTTTYTNTLVIDESLDETSDFRADMINEVQVAMNGRLALKVSLRVLFDNEPAFEELDVFDSPDQSNKVGTVDAQKDSTDTVFTASLVVNF